MSEFILKSRSDGIKHDTNKPRLDLIPGEVLMALGSVLTKGAEKYSDNNWQGLERHRVVAALLRHVALMQMGEVVDKESHLPHSFHILANASFLSYFDSKK